MKICQFGFCIINSMPKMLDLNTLKPLFYIFIVHASLKTQRKFTIHPKKRGPIMLSGHTPFSHYHANSVAVWQVLPWKKGQWRHQAMHHFHATTPIILLFHELRLEKMANYAITPTAGGSSYITSYFNLDSICVPYAYAV